MSIDILRFGSRNLHRNKRRTLITSLSVALGVCVAVIFLGSRQNTYDRLIDTGAKGGFGMLTISQPDFIGEPSAASRIDYRSLMDTKLKQLPAQVRLVPRIAVMAVIATAKNSTGAQILGVDPRAESKAVNLMLNWMTAGDPLTANDATNCVIGSRLANNLGLKLGDKAVISATDAKGQIVSNLIYVKGLFATGSPEVDAHLVMVPLTFTQQLLGYKAKEASYLAAYAPIEASLTKLKAQLDKKLHGARVQVSSWRQSLPDIAQAIEIDRALCRLLFIFTGAIVAIGILNTMMLNVIERQREFGVMLALGMSPLSLVLMLLWEGLLLGLIGLVIGAALATPIYLYLHYVGLDLRIFMEATDRSVTFVDEVIGCRVTLAECAVIASALVLLNILAVLYPAIKAGWTLPIKAMRTP